jgi:competence protein ComEA
MFDLNIAPEQKRALIILATFCLGVGGFFFLNSRPAATLQSGPEILQEITPSYAESTTSTVIVTGSRVVDALTMAGNQIRGVDISDINLARLLVDGEQILVGTPPAAAAKKAAARVTSNNPLDLNRATASQLDTLPGIGPVTAQRILDYRAKVGRINAVDELKKISGLGGAKFEEIKDLLRV